MRYNLEVRSIARAEQSISSKHAEFVSNLLGIPEPWGVREQLPAPDPGSGLSASLKLSKILGPGLKGDLVYQLRRPFRDEAAHDDWLNMSFDPAKVRYEELVYSVFPRYVAAFDAYYGEIADDEFVFMDHAARARLKVDKRKALYRIAPVSFLDDSFCRRALGMDIEAVEARLAGKVEKTSRIGAGILIVLTSQILPTESMDKLCWSVKQLLVGGDS